ncbi:glutamine ABC transporter permease [Clostridia bacterium]|nr:glutamine ABC transporter permease [Clostridia bacterium]
MGKISIRDFVDSYWFSKILIGLRDTLLLTSGAIIVGLVVGALIAFVRVQHRFSGNLRLLNILAACFVQIFRGTPILIQLFIIRYSLFGSLRSCWIPVILVYGLNSGAYVSEILRASVGEVNVGQYEAARILGFSDKQTLSLVIFPQAFRDSIPTLLNEFCALIKETSVAYIVGFLDFGSAMVNLSFALKMNWPYYVSALVYFLIILFVSHSLNRIVRRFAAKKIRKEQIKYIKGAGLNKITKRCENG